MNRQNILAALLLLCTALVGCAADGEGVEVVTSDLGETRFELVEVRSPEGRIDVDVYFEAGQAEEVSRHFDWAESEPVPPELVTLLAQLDDDVLADARPLSADDARVEIDPEAIWPRLLQLARFEREQRTWAERCDDTTGFTDCVGR